MSQQLTLELSDETYQQLQNQANEVGLSLTDLILTKLNNLNRVENELDTIQKEQARQRFKSRAGSISLGYSTGIDNESIDADLAKVYANES